jgi:hypothetical protein
MVSTIGAIFAVTVRVFNVDLRDTPEEEAFRLELRTWLGRNAPSGPHPPRGTARYFASAIEWHKRLHAEGYAGLSWPMEHWGRGASAATQIIFEEELGRAGVPGFANQIGINNIGPAIMVHGTPEQNARYLPAILSADEIWCQGYSEPNAGSDLASLRTRAVEDGDTFVVTGQKVWTTWGQYAHMCQLLVRTDPGERKHDGLSVLLVDMSLPGITVKPLRQMSGSEEFNEVFFDEVRVPKDALLGARGEGWRVAMSTLSNERAGVLTLHVRVSRLVRDLAALAVEHGRAEDPVVRQAIGRCALGAHQLRLFSYWAASNPEPGMVGPMAKLLWSETVQAIHETAADLLGPAAVRDGPWLYGLLDSRGLTILAGTTEIQKNLLAERALGLPR